MPDPIKAYLKQIEAALAAGNATEHTHRPALKALIEALAPGVTAINEPGIMTDLEPWQLYQEILGDTQTPFLSTSLVDARG